MSPRTAARLAWSVCAAMVASLVTGTLLLVVNARIDREEVSGVVVLAIVALVRNPWRTDRARHSWTTWLAS